MLTLLSSSFHGHAGNFSTFSSAITPEIKITFNSDEALLGIASQLFRSLERRQL
jgi:hypothetical protein